MTININEFYKQKISWLESQVDVDFPTPESIEGRKIYTVQPEPSELLYHRTTSLLSDMVTVLQVTEHRLTIRWAMVVASQWKTEYDLVLEFLTQIELSNEYQLFLALDGMTPIAACLTRVDENNLFASDVVVIKSSVDKNDFMNAVIEQQSILTGKHFISCYGK